MGTGTARPKWEPSPWSEAFADEPTEIGETARVYLLAAALRLDSAAWAAVFDSYLAEDGVLAGDPDSPLGPAFPGDRLWPFVKAALEDLMQGKRHRNLRIGVATELPLALPAALLSREPTTEICRADLTLAIQVPNGSNNFRAQLVIEAKRGLTSGQSFRRVLAPPNRNVEEHAATLDASLRPFVGALQPVAYAGVLAAYDQDAEAHLRVVGTLGAGALEWRSEAHKWFERNGPQRCPVYLAADRSWDEVTELAGDIARTSEAREILGTLRRLL